MKSPSLYRDKRSTYLILIPVLNEGPRIVAQLARMRTLLQTYDCAIVDGGSTDGALTDSMLREHGVRGWLTSPRGLSVQMRTGLAWGLAQGYDGIILIDGNDKDDPAAIPLFAKSLDEGFDHVQGSRFVAGGRAERTPISRWLGIRLLHAPLIALASGFRYTDTTNGFRAYSRRLLTDARVQPFRDVFQKYELHYYLAIRAARLKFRVVEVPVTRSYPADGAMPTKITFYRGNLKVLQTLFAAVFGRFDPEAP